MRPEQGRKLVDNIQKVYDADFSVIVYNFLDILSHARTETDIIRELTEDEAAFRSLTRSWFEHSDIFTMLKLLSERGHTVIITSDHGTIRVDNPVKVTGDREPRPTCATRRAASWRTTPARCTRCCARRTSSCRRQPHVELHLRLQHRLSGLQQRRQPPHPLLPQHVPARRHLDGGDDRTLHRAEAQAARRPAGSGSRKQGREPETGGPSRHGGRKRRTEGCATDRKPANATGRQHINNRQHIRKR